MTEIKSIFADGGVIQRNPSPLGGTWAFCHIDAAGNRVLEKSGIVLPSAWNLPAMTNNFTELFAVVRALVLLPCGWNGTVYSDSKITLGRLFWEYKGWEGIPDDLREMAETNVARLGKVKAILLDGHPNRAQLAAGIGKRGNPCHAENVWCDEQCRIQSAQFFAMKNSAN